MNKAELIKRVAKEMRENNIKKPVTSPKHVFHISDNEGNSKDFIVRRTEKTVQYTIDDVAAVIDTCIDVIKDAIKTGEPVSVYGFGTLGLHYRKARRARHPETGELVEVAARYVPKFLFGNELRVCAKLFELSLEDGKDYLSDLENFEDQESLFESEGGE